MISSLWNGVNVKTCKKCGNELEEVEFSLCKANSDGLQRWCRKCMKKSKDKWDVDNAEHKAEYKLEYNTAHREEGKAYSKQYRRDNIEKCREYDKQYWILNKEHKSKLNIIRHARTYELNREKIIKRVTAYIKANPEKHKGYMLKTKHKRRSNEANSVRDFTTEQWNECKKSFKFCCAYCGRKLKLEQDHLIPVTKSGPYTKTNILPACRTCNNSKNNSYVDEWYPRQKFFTQARFNNINSYISQR